MQDSAESGNKNNKKSRFSYNPWALAAIAVGVFSVFYINTLLGIPATTISYLASVVGTIMLMSYATGKIIKGIASIPQVQAGFRMLGSALQFIDDKIARPGFSLLQNLLFDVANMVAGYLNSGNNYSRPRPKSPSSNTASKDIQTSAQDSAAKSVTTENKKSDKPMNYHITECQHCHCKMLTPNYEQQQYKIPKLKQPAPTTTQVINNDLPEDSNSKTADNNDMPADIKSMYY